MSLETLPTTSITKT
jgi:hypothetical protein